MLVTIKSLKQYILTQDEYQWILDNMHKPFKVMQLTFDYTSGKVWSIAIYRPGENDDDVTCISLFVDTNKLRYELGG